MFLGHTNFVTGRLGSASLIYMRCYVNSIRQLGVACVFVPIRLFFSQREPPQHQDLFVEWPAERWCHDLEFASPLRAHA